ncbi:ABC transporter substrate-binding protein [Thermotoga caldifontis]|uniref:ABC transporter substrate-binding protein n=1 Tax=Thermotoga caldifontis TaxID=1508419 RepID=UPI0005977AE7|nr:ABC transporter substrate-binding protein [Thermotoga caldifontis]
MRKYLSLLLLIAVSVGMAVNVLVPVGPTVVAFVGLLEKRVDSDVELKIDFWRTLDQVSSQIASKNVDLIVLPVSIGASLYAKGIDVRLAAVTLWSGFYIVTRDFDLTDLKMLSGQEVYTPQGKGQTGDVLIRYFLEQAGLKPDTDVKIRYAAPAEIVSLMSAGKVKIAVLPEPYATLAVKRAQARIAQDLQILWSKYTNLPARIPITGVFVVKNLDETTLRAVLKAIENSLRYSMENKREAAQLSVNYLGGMPAEIIEESLARTLYEYTPASEAMDEVIRYLTVTQQVDPDAMPTLPDEKFFTF